MNPPTVLVVCTGNICRSPVAEALLSHDLADLGVTVRSAGTHAVEGHPPSPEALDFIADGLGDFDHHLGEQLAKETAEGADLLLTMTEEQRAWVLRLAPRTVRHTFTLLEFARIAASLEREGPFMSLPEMVRACAPLRRRYRRTGAPNDVLDPSGRAPEVYAHSFSLIENACSTIAPVLRARLLRGVP